MNKKSIDGKYFYQIDEHDIVHLFRGEDDCQQYLTNPLLSAILKIETLEKENEELKEFRQDCVRLTEDNVVMARQRAETSKELVKAKELIKALLRLWNDVMTEETVNALIAEAEQFIKETDK